MSSCILLSLKIYTEENWSVKSIQIDYREEKLFKSFPQAERANLEIGDIVSGEVCIERKSGEDYVSSIIDGRIFNQSLNMKNNYKLPFILVESDLDRIAKYLFFAERRIEMEVIRGATAKILTTYGVSVVFCSTKSNFIEMVNLIIEKGKDSNSPEMVIKQISKGKIDPKMLVLLSIPKIGEKKAKRILDFYGSIGNINIKEIPQGVSAKDIQRIQEVLK